MKETIRRMRKEDGEGMRPILILTKNLLVEQRLQEVLQLLDYEVFCSVEVLNFLKHGHMNEQDRKQALLNYQMIILSETLSDHEIEVLLPQLCSKKQVVVRKYAEEPTAKDKELLSELGIHEWLLTDESIDQLREKLSISLADYQKDTSNIVFLYRKENEEKSAAQLVSRSLSKREWATLQCLVNAKEKVVSREALCNHLWGEAPNNSHLSQLSVLIKRLKDKLECAGFEESITTVWGKGYHFSNESIEKEMFI
ncbi:winged helix-turn-helix domain-containing protein [Enterococcus sp. DIV0187]|uniref:winged helix-turn-helix domain-containing protein n=1 Tax=Enterococcus sp. DIV0187 TaxID=2774644 RepID=UPI003F22EF4F